MCVLTGIILISGCSSPYYGYTKQEWDGFSEKEQAAIKAEYQTVIDAKNNQAHTDKINDRTQSVIDYGVSPGKSAK